MSVPQQINFIRRLEKYDDTMMLFVAEKQEKTSLKFSLDSLIVTL